MSVIPISTLPKGFLDKPLIINVKSIKFDKKTIKKMQKIVKEASSGEAR